jgi:predicted RNase H-like HicB family nuclease
MRHLQLTAVVHKDEDMYVADCPEVGTVSQGYTFEEAVENLKEATELFLEEFPEKVAELSKRERPSAITTFEAEALIA